MAKSKLDRARTTAKNLREQVTELEDEVASPPLTGGRIAARIGKGLLGTTGAILAGATHGRSVGGPVEVQHVGNIVGGVSQLLKFVAAPDGAMDLATEAPLQVMRGNIAIGVRNMRED